MSSYEYTVIPAPARGEKTRGAKTGIDRFAATLTDTLNQMAGDGWEYVRAETLPAEERSGLTSRTTVYHNLLVFRRALAQTAALPQPDQGARTQAPDPAPLDPPAPERPPQTTAEPVRAPFSQPMRAMPRQQPQARVPEPPLTAPPQPAPPQGPRLGPATR